MIRKLGLILECDAGGPDELVFRCFVRRLSPDTEVEVLTMGNKEALMQKGAEAAQGLIEDNNCDLVIIAWDLKPLWEKPGNCEIEADVVRSSLKALSKPLQKKVRLLCLTYELETWLLADQAAIRSYLSTSAHPCKWKSSKKAESYTDAKATLNKIVKDHRGPRRRYEDFREAIRLAAMIDSTNKLLKVQSFQRFCKLLTGSDSAEFLSGGEICADLSHSANQMGR